MHRTQELPRDSWAAYLQQVTDELANVPVTVEVTEPEQSPAVEARRMALQALTYDTRADAFELTAATGGPHLPALLRHMVEHPARIEADSIESPATLTPSVIVVVDQAGVRTVVQIAAEAAFSG